MIQTKFWLDYLLLRSLAVMINEKLDISVSFIFHYFKAKNEELMNRNIAKWIKN